MVKDRLKALKTKADISCAEWSKLSTVPEATIRKILSGETPDPRFDTIVKLVTCVGGSMDDIVGAKKESEIENNAVMVLREAYETRIEALRERLDDVKKYAESLQRDKKMLVVAVVVLVSIIVSLLVFDIALDTNGWLQK
ncbi:MAG: helix-turn-helix domain-containing protein [Bacteroidaceae bacterium]|nr:helix-turn-helix domain-containing protein [Bacteroidaceae bacterium]